MIESEAYLEKLRAPSHEYLGVCTRRAMPVIRRMERWAARRGPSCSQPRVHIALRPYQETVFHDRSSGIQILHWSRQIGKSFTLAAWAVDRLLTRPGRLVTVLSNSRENGAEFVAKCAEVCRLNGTDYESVDKSHGVQFQNMRMEVRIRAQGRTGRIKVLAANPRTARGFSGDLILDEFAFHEDSAAIWEAAEPILSSNPDFLCRIASTGNGKHNLFYRMTNGAHAETNRESTQINANSDPSFLPSLASVEKSPPAAALQSQGEEAAARVAGTDSYYPRAYFVGATSDTHPQEAAARGARQSDRDGRGPQGNGVSGAHAETNRESTQINANSDPSDSRSFASIGGSGHASGLRVSSLGYKVSRVPRTAAFKMGVQVYDANTRLPITPEQARAQALDKRAYDQNYECAFADENMTLLTHGLISAAEREDVGFICEGDWSGEFLQQCRTGFQSRTREDRQDARPTLGDIYVGVDVGRNRDLTVITVMEKIGDMHFVRGILRLAEMRLPDQQLRLGEVCRLPKFRRCCIDMTGIGLGLTEYSQDKFGQGRIHGINFASTVPLTKNIASDGRARETVRVTEAMATELLSVYEDRRIQHPGDGELRDDLRKPEKRTSPGGRVSIAATRDEAGHADHFWSFALALEAAASAPAPFHYRRIERPVRGAWL